MAYWLMKSEPRHFSIDDLRAEPAPWDGVRNFQARNFLTQMQIGDRAFFYHSNTSQPGIVGEMIITREAFPDPSQFDRYSDGYDPRASQEKPLWQAVEVTFAEKYPEKIPLCLLRHLPALADTPLVRTGNRLSVMPVSATQWQAIAALRATL